MGDPKELLRETRDHIAPPSDVLGSLERRRHRREQARRVSAAVVAFAIAVAGLAGWLAVARYTGEVPADDVSRTDLGIFAPVAGQIVYGDADGIWGVDPAAPATRVRLTDAGSPIGWSSDATQLLILHDYVHGRKLGWSGRLEFPLAVLHADGSETKVADVDRQSFAGATISPDGSRVVFASYTALYSVDVGRGRPVVLLRAGDGDIYNPTFSPDGAKIAYIAGGGDHGHRVWVVNADGSHAHQILDNATTEAAHVVTGLAWSPAGDQIALGLDLATYTFATNGSGFTQVVAGTEPHWSPDGSQLEITDGSCCDIAIANADGSNAVALGGVAGSGPWNPAPGAPG